MQALVLNAPDRAFHFEDVDMAAPMGAKSSSKCRRPGSVTRTAVRHPSFRATARGARTLVAGVVAAVGPDVGQHRVGDHVVGSLI